MTINMKNVLKFLPIVIVLVLLGWGISSKATDDIKSATANFSVIGTVGLISEDGITITDAKGSDKSGKTSYDLNVKYLEEIEMNTYDPLNFTDIKTGDKIIAQGLTNGDTFFIKRIISFTSTPTPVVPKEIATSTATTTDDIATSTGTSTENGIATTSDEDANLTSTTTGEVVDSSTSSEEITSATSSSIIETVTDAVQEIVQTVTDTVQAIVEAVIPSDPAPSTE